jgi:uncharacterized protein YjiS (DUF1127 family)
MERAMTLKSISQQSSTWSHFKHRIVEWRRRSLSRQELESLSDATLRDIGITRCDAKLEASKPFWMT